VSRFALRRHKFCELLLRGDVAAALACLHKELTPLCAEAGAPDQAHGLAALLVCQVMPPRPLLFSLPCPLL
jgi:hypothetical protein